MEKVRHGTDMVQTPVLKGCAHTHTELSSSSFPVSETSGECVATGVKGGGETKLKMEM